MISIKFKWLTYKLYGYIRINGTEYDITVSDDGITVVACCSKNGINTVHNTRTYSQYELSGLQISVVPIVHEQIYIETYCVFHIMMYIKFGLVDLERFLVDLESRFGESIIVTNVLREFDRSGSIKRLLYEKIVSNEKSWYISKKTKNTIKRIGYMDKPPNAKKLIDMGILSPIRKISNLLKR